MATLIDLGGVAEAGKDEVAVALERVGWINHMSFSIELNVCLLIMNPWLRYEVAQRKDGTFDKFEDIWPCDELGRRPPMRYADFFQACGGYPGYTRFKSHPEVRRLMQVFGTEVGRERLGDDIWVEAKRREITPDLDAGRKVVLTAVRFHNELALIRELGGLAVWVERPGYGPVNEHISDHELNALDFDMILLNNSTLADLHTYAVGLEKQVTP